MRMKTSEGYKTVRRSSGDLAVIISDAFATPIIWNGFMNPPEFHHVILDHHSYQCFSPGLLGMMEEMYIDTACRAGNVLRAVDKWTVVGEWSGAYTDCAKWLNGVGNGSNYQGEMGILSYQVGKCGKKTAGRVAELSAEEQGRIRR